MRIDVTFTPEEISRISNNDLKNTVCAVFDVLRATSVIVTALNNGARAVIPASSIPEALELKRKYPEALLAGERNGFKISSALTGGVEFDFGNSPREFTPENVSGKLIITTTTNGTRGIKAVENAKEVLICSFLNLKATSDYIAALNPSRLLIVCCGTNDEATSEDILAAGKLVDVLSVLNPELPDKTIVARDFFRFHKDNLQRIGEISKHARKLLSFKELADDVHYCMQTDCVNLVAAVKNGMILRIS